MSALSVNDVAALLGALGTGAVGGSLVTHRLTVQRDKRSDRRDQMRQAASALREALTGVQGVVEASPPAGLVDPRAVAERMASWGKAFERWEEWLPDRARHVDRSVSDAVATHLGVLGRSHRLPEYVSENLADNTDADWQENALGYIAHVIWWLDASNRDGQWHGLPYNFDDWLSARDERRAAFARGEITRVDRWLNRLFRADGPTTSP